MVEKPHELRSYIAERHSRILRGNNADNKGTSQAELDNATKDCETFYECGRAFIATISSEDLERCKKLCAFRTRTEYFLTELVESAIDGKRMLIPKYLIHIEELRKLQEILA